MNKMNDELLNKELSKIWNDPDYVIPNKLIIKTPEILIDGKKFYRKIHGEYYRVYKKYGFMPKI